MFTVATYVPAYRISTFFICIYMSSILIIMSNKNLQHNKFFNSKSIVIIILYKIHCKIKKDFMRYILLKCANYKLLFIIMCLLLLISPSLFFLQHFFMLMVTVFILIRSTKQRHMDIN